MNIRNLFLIMAAALSISSCSASSAKSEAKAADTDTQAVTVALPDTALMITQSIPEGSKRVAVKTSMGDFTLLLYGDTPLHRDNFLKLVNDHAYDSVLFHRVINNFMVQAGDPSSKNAAPGQRLGSNQVGENVPAEIVFPTHFHKRGALAAARTGDAMNPERKSSGSQFYIVTGKTYTDDELDQMDRRLRYSVGQSHFNQLAREHEADIRRWQAEGDTTALRNLQQQLADQTEAWLDTQNVGMTPEMREAYKKVGGTPHLDNEYTVYGEVIDGMATIDRIQHVQTGAEDRPVEDVRIISMQVLD